MSQSQTTEKHAELSVENIGGIDTSEITFSPGVTSLTGRNATNRTSLLQALMATLGSEHVSLKGDADHGEVTLTLGNDTYTRTLERRNSTVVFDGDPYLEDIEAAELFGFLLESNEARQAVARDDDLREVIMRPVDTAAIQAEIEQLEAEKRQLDDELDRLDTLDSRLPELEAEKTRLEDQLEDKRAELDEKEAEIEDADKTVDDTREQQNAFEDALDELQEVRSDLEDARYRIETERESIQALEDEHDELEDTLEDLPETPAGDLEEVNSEIDRLRDHKQSLESTINQLQRILQFNEDLLDGDNPELQAALQNRDGTDSDSDTDDEDDALTDQLVEDTTVCWTCGSEVERDAIDDTLESLRELRREHSSKRNEIDAELDELTDRRDALRGDRDRRERVDRKLDEIDREIDEREATLDDLTDERATLEDEIDERETAVEELEGQEQSELLDHHKEANQLEFELGRLESDLDDVREEIASVEEDLDERDQLSERREELQTELADLRTRIEQLESEAVEEFNDHMETILGVLDYANIERIWIERTEQTVREGRRKVDRGAFDLHVIRSTQDGTTYEDSIAHLSESEREVTGLVFALAGYLVHDLHESLPVIVIDSLEALDSDRIAALVEYFEEYAEYLIVALLPEDAAALSDEFQRVTEI
ncbi:archaea-specific SMC-related protein [Halococcus salifodinae]|uniref:Chromosome segregation protein (Spc25, Csm1, Pcs1) n=1 Tax=Halococcus salifodinae DSM 8989 TaxID=1227456 RepID=M0MVH9_9EURY|nr:archaea-specific SMC-related protein [Halococcus salifodinae]EMA48430.1 Chromosome segregation protein (Spc25, Csm1, Pcs1) [Halococcus salifodinae DSM 8989]